MQELKKITKGGNSVVIGWPKSDEAYEYVVEGMTELFNYIPITRIKNCSYVCPDNSEFIGYRVLYISKNDTNECVIDSTNMFIPQEENLAKMDILAVKAIYDKISLSFHSDEQYDLYRLYNGNGELISEAEDCIIMGDFKDEKYYVEGYMKVGDGYELKGVSDVITCKPMQNLHNENPLLSIVIPVYNSKMFLARTLQSILSSTFNNFEIILVDDGSEMETREICDWYANNFDCIDVIHKENGGVSSARNRGMEEVKSEWLAFVDADDIIHPYMYQKLFDAANKHGTSIAISQCMTRDDYEKHVNVFPEYQNQRLIIMNSFDDVLKYRGWAQNVYFTSSVNKIVKTEIATKVIFDENLRHYEDIAYTQTIYSYLDKFVLVKDAYYIYDKRKQKTVGTLSNSGSSKPYEFVWRDYVIALAYPLFKGNRDKNIAYAYKYDIIKRLLQTYTTKDYAKLIKNIIAGMIKYFIREYDLPIEDLLNSEENNKFCVAWQEIKNNNLPEYDGGENIPEEYYQR